MPDSGHLALQRIRAGRKPVHAQRSLAGRTEDRHRAPPWIQRGTHPSARSDEPCSDEGRRLAKRLATSLHADFGVSGQAECPADYRALTDSARFGTCRTSERKHVNTDETILTAPHIPGGAGPGSASGATGWRSRALEKFVAERAVSIDEFHAEGTPREFSARQYLLSGGAEHATVELFRGSTPVDPTSSARTGVRRGPGGRNRRMDGREPLGRRRDALQVLAEQGQGIDRGQTPSDGFWTP